MLKRHIFIILILSPMLACNNNPSESIPKVDSSKVIPSSLISDSSQNLSNDRVTVFNPDSIYGNWRIEIMHKKNSCESSKIEHSSSEIWRIYKDKGKIKVNEIIGSITKLVKPNEGIIKQNYLEITGKHKNASEELITVTGSLEFSDTRNFSGTMKEVTSPNCITTYKVYGSKN